MAYDIPSISDLEAIQLLNKHYAEVITSKEDGVSSAADITQTTNPITGVTRRTLYKILDDMDVEHDAQMQSFENDFDSRLAGMAFTRVGTFTAGSTLTDMRQTLLWEVSQGGDGHEYGWTGSFPKVVAAGSTPATSGGIGAGAWVDRTDVVLRDQLAESTGATRVGNANGGSVQDFIDAHVTNNFFNALNPKYNIKNDASANADVGFAMLVDDIASAGGGVMFVPAGDYLVKHIDLVTLSKSNIQIIGEGKGITRFIFDSSGGRVTQPGYPSPTFARNNSADGLFYISAHVSNQTDDSLSVKNIKFRDLTIDMDVETNGFDELMHAISAFGVSGLDVKYCELKGFLGDGVAVNRGNGTYSNAYNKNVIIKNNTIDGVNKDNRNGVSIYYCDGFDVSRNIITRTSRPDMPGAIDIEPDTNLMQTNSGYIGYNLINDIGGNIAAIAIITRNGGKTTTGIEVVGNNLSNVKTPFAVINLGGDADNDPLIEFRLNTVTGYSFAPFYMQNTRDINLVNNSWRNGTQAVATFSVLSSKRIKISGGSFNSMSAQDGVLVDNLSSDFEMCGVEFANMAKHAATINYNNSTIKVTKCKFTSTATAAVPVKTNLLSMPSAEYSNFSENTSGGLFSACDEKAFLTLLTSSGVYPTNYNSMQPKQYPYGETVFYSAGLTPEPFAGDSDAIVVTVRDKYSPTITTVKQTVTLRDPTATAYYQRFAASNTTWHPFKKVSLVSL